MNNKYDFMFFVQARNCNPNGDPDMGNLPRIDEETMQGLMTDVCIKRNIRNYIEDAFAGVEGMDIVVREASNMNESIAKIVLDVNGGKIEKKKKNTKIAEARTLACHRYFDVRAFGGVLSTGLNAGQILGPVQFEFGKTLDAIFVKDIAITRNCHTEGEYNNLDDYQKLAESLEENKKRTIGRKQFITYGLYQVYGYISAAEANKTGFSENDLKALFESILNMYNYSTSATKAGMSVVTPIIIFKHVGSPETTNAAERTREAILGCAPSYKLQELVEIKKRDDVEYPRDYTDYDICINLSGLPKGVEVGFKYLPFEDIVWGQPNDGWLTTR